MEASAPTLTTKLTAKEAFVFLKEQLKLEEQKVKENYFKRGIDTDPNNWVISNSLLGMYDPDNGGHPKKFYNVITGQEEGFDETKSLERGTLLHDYMENPEDFLVSEVEKPDEKLGIVADEVATSLLGSELTEISDEMFDGLLLGSIRKVGWNNKWSDEAVLKNTRDKVKPYVLEVLQMKGKRILTKATKEIVTNAIKSINENVTIQELLNVDEEKVIVLKEYVVVVEELGFKLKGKLDRVHIHIIEDTVTNSFRIEVMVIDYKTSGGSVSKFVQTLESYKYHRQLSMYGILIRRLVIELLPRIDVLVGAIVIAVETSGYFISAPIVINDYWLIEGDREKSKLLSKIRINLEANNFNVTAEEIITGGYLTLDRFKKERRTFIQ
jgi:hypothetical protein